MFFTLLLSVSVLGQARCPLGAVESTEYNSCYLHGPVTATWQGAEEMCQVLGGHLPSIKDQQQNDVITSIMQEHTFEALWIGGHYNGTAWNWSDGTKFSFKHFLGAASYARDGYSASILLDDPAPGYSGYWQSEDTYFTARAFICQIPRCDSSSKSAPSILQNPTAMNYSSLSNSWYYSYGQGFAKPKDAESNCAALGAHLPSVHSGFENTQLLNILQDQTGLKVDMAFGLFSDANGNNFQFTDNTTLSYTNWAPGEPKKLNYNEDSLFNSGTGRWSTTGDSVRAPDTETFVYACQFPASVNYCL